MSELPSNQRAIETASGQSFGKYLLLRRLAVGGMAEVFLAKLEAAAGFQKPVVLKHVLPQLATDPQFVEMFLDEARLAARLSHPNIAQTFDLGEEEGEYFIAMEYVAGESLLAVLRRAESRKTPVPMQCTLRVLLELLEALGYAHGLTDDEGRALRIVHRDVSPSNVMITYHGGVKLLDFGIARAATRNHQTSAGIIKGKHGFMAPEQYKSGSTVDLRADLYASGAVLYALAVGRPAFDVGSGPLVERMREMTEARFPAPREVRPEVPAELERVILKAMARSVDARYATASEMAADLERFAAAEGLFPAARPLGELVRGLFPEKMPLATAVATQVDAKEVAQLIERTRTGPESEEVRASESTSLETRSDRPVGAAGAPDSPATTLGSEPSFTREVGVVRAAPTHVVASAGQRRALQVAGAGVGALALVAAVAWGVSNRVGTQANPPEGARPVPVARPADDQAARPALSANLEEPRRVEPAPTADPTPAPSPASPQPSADAGRGDAEPVRHPAGAIGPALVARSSSSKATGWLMLDSYPWTHVSEKGKLLGPTPLRVELPEGVHQLLLENKALGVRRVVKLTVKAGKETARFERIARPP